MGLGEQGNKCIYFRGTMEHRFINEGNRGTKAGLGNKEHMRSRFWFSGTGEKSDSFQGNENKYSWDCLTKKKT